MSTRSQINWLGLLGLLGFMGFLRSYQGEPQYVFFAFFGFFSFFFVMPGKRISQSERIICKVNSVILSMFMLLLGVLLTLVILNNNLFHVQHISMKVVELAVALLFALVSILRAVLTYIYSKE